MRFISIEGAGQKPISDEGACKQGSEEDEPKSRNYFVGLLRKEIVLQAPPRRVGASLSAVLPPAVQAGTSGVPILTMQVGKKGLGSVVICMIFCDLERESSRSLQGLAVA